MVLAASRRVLARGLALAATVLVVSCGGADAPAPVLVGAGDSVESRVLAEIYAQALARAGSPAAVRPDLGTRTDYLNALDAGTVSVVGEHSGALLTEFDNESGERTLDSVSETLYGSLPQGLVISDSAQNTDLGPKVVLADTFAEQHAITTVGELTPHCSALTVGTAPVPGLLPPSGPPADIEGCEFAATVPVANADELRRALADGRVQVGIFGGPVDLVPGGVDGVDVLADVLADEEYAMGAQNVLALVREGVLSDREMGKLGAVGGELTTDELVTLIRSVRDDGADPSESVRSWLDAHEL